MPVHSVGDYAHFLHLPQAGAGGRTAPNLHQTLLKTDPLIQAMSPERRAVNAVLPHADRQDMSHPDALKATVHRMGSLGVPFDPTKAGASRVCPKCGSGNIRAFEAQADTGYDEMEGKCRDCNHRAELGEFAKKTAGILTFDEVREAARKSPDYAAKLKAMEARRTEKTAEGLTILEFGDVCHTADGFTDHSEFAKAEARKAIDAFHSDLKTELKQAASLGQMTPLQADPDGGENHPPLLGNPFMGDDKSSTEYENGYQYAQSLGHQQLNVATEGDVARWQNAEKAWLAGFCAGARSIGVGRLADTIEQTKQGHAMDTFATDYLKKTSGALLPLATTLGGAGLGGLAGLYGGSQMVDSDPQGAANLLGPIGVDSLQGQLLAQGAQPNVIAQLGHHINEALHVPVVPLDAAASAATQGTPGLAARMHQMPDIATGGVTGGAAIGGAAGLAGGLAIGGARRAEPKFATAHLVKLSSLLPLATTLGGTAIGGLLGGAAGQDQDNRFDQAMVDYRANAVDPSHADPGLQHRFTDPATDALRQVGNEVHSVLPQGYVPQTNMTAGALGGATVGAGAGLAGGLLLDSRRAPRNAADPKFAQGKPMTHFALAHLEKTAVALDRLLLPAAGAIAGGVIGQGVGDVAGYLGSGVPSDIAAHLQPDQVHAINADLASKGVESGGSRGALLGTALGAGGGVIASDMLRKNPPGPVVRPYGV